MADRAEPIGYGAPMSPPASADRSFLRSARTVSVLTLLSRVLGMLRDVATARLLGAGLVADSVPTNEHEECRNKAAAVLAAITMAEGLRPAGPADATMTHH